MLKKSFITGLVIWLPIALTATVMMIVVNFLTKPFVGMASQILSNYEFWKNGFLFLNGDQLLLYGSQGMILLMLMLFTVAVGVLARWLFLHSLINMGTRILDYIPFVNTVYRISRDVISTLLQTQTDAFRKPVIVPFPNPNIYSLGLITRSSPDRFSEAVKDELISVFVPTTPNPTSGFLLMMKEEDVTQLDMPIEDAIKFIISCGVIHPEPNVSLKEAAQSQIRKVLNKEESDES